VRGRVVDADSGVALVGVECRLALGGTEVVTFTCADGSYEYEDLTALVMRKQDGNAQISYDLPNYDEKVETFNLASGQTPTRNMALAKSVLFPNTLTGVVFDAVTSTAVEGAQVQLEGPANLAITTGDDGLYAFDALLPGNYTVRTSAQTFDSLAVPKTVAPSPTVQQLDVPLTKAVVVTTPGDVNGDDDVNAVDVQLVINAALGLTSEGNPDINGDATVNAVDVQLVINAALGIKI